MLHASVSAEGCCEWLDPGPARAGDAAVRLCWSILGLWLRFFGGWFARVVTLGRLAKLISLDGQLAAQALELRPSSEDGNIHLAGLRKGMVSERLCCDVSSSSG